MGGLVDRKLVVQKFYDDSAFSWKCEDRIQKQMLQGKIWGSQCTDKCKLAVCIPQLHSKHLSCTQKRMTGSEHLPCEAQKASEPRAFSSVPDKPDSWAAEVL